MAVEIDYSVQGARSKYHIDQTPSKINESQLKNDGRRTPYYLYGINPHPWPKYGGNVPGSFLGGIYTELETERFAYGSKPTGKDTVGRVIVPLIASRISIPPMGVGLSWQQYCQNIRDQLTDRIYLLSPIRFYQTGNLHNGNLIDSLSLVDKPPTAPLRTIFSQYVQVVGLPHLNREMQKHLDIKEGYYTDTETYTNAVRSPTPGQYTPLEETMRGAFDPSNKTRTNSNKLYPTKFSELSRSVTPGRTMGYSQSYLYFTDLRPPETIIRWDDGVSSSSPTRVIAKAGGYAESTIQMIRGSVVESDTDYLKGKIVQGVYSEKWYNNSQDLIGGLGHYVIPDHCYYTIYPKRYDGTRREVVYKYNRRYKETDIYSCLYSIETNNSLVVIDIDDRYLLKNKPDITSTWLSIPKYQEGEMNAIDHAKYRHLSLFHVRGSNNRIILKIGTERLPARFVHNHSDKDYLSLFSFAPGTKSNMVLLAYTQEDLDKRVQEAANYFRLNDPPNGYNSFNREHYSIQWTYRPSEYSTTLVQGVSPGNPAKLTDLDKDYFRYFDEDDIIHELYNAYPMIPRLNNVNHGINLFGSFKAFTTNIIVGNDKLTHLPYLERYDGVDASLYHISDDVPTLPENHPIKKMKGLSNLGTQYNDYFFYKPFAERDEKDLIKIKYHVHRHDPYTDGTKYEAFDQVRSCFNALALILHVKPAVTIDKDEKERVYIIEGSEEKTYHFKTMYSNPVLFSVTGSNLNVTIIIKCKMNIVLNPAEYTSEEDRLRKVNSFIYTTVAVHGENNKVKIVYDEGAYIRFVHQGDQRPYFIVAMNGNHNTPPEQGTNEVYHMFTSIEGSAYKTHRYIVDKNRRETNPQNPPRNIPLGSMYGGNLLPNTKGDGSVEKPWWAAPMTMLLEYNLSRGVGQPTSSTSDEMDGWQRGRDVVITSGGSTGVSARGSIIRRP